MGPRTPILIPVAPGITAIDTDMAGERELNAVYLISGSAPTLVEAGPGADLPVVLEGLRILDVSPDALAHIVVTHIHLDHAGGAGALLARFPRATLWAHERGVQHLVDPVRLLASTARTYGAKRMADLFGPTEPVPPERIRGIADGDRIGLGDRTLTVLHTPGHASHHVAVHEDGTGAIFAGEAVGSYLPWGPAYRPALPPPEVDIERAVSSIDRIAAMRPTRLLTSHFGALPSDEDGCSLAKESILAWSERVRELFVADPDISPEAIETGLEKLAQETFSSQAGRALTGVDRTRYDALGSIAMNATGLARYWRKRWEAERSER